MVKVDERVAHLLSGLPREVWEGIGGACKTKPLKPGV